MAPQSAKTCGQRECKQPSFGNRFPSNTALLSPNLRTAGRRRAPAGSAGSRPQSAVSVPAPCLPFLTKIFLTFVMNQKGFHGTSFLGVLCGRKQPKGKAGRACWFARVRGGNHFQWPETGVNYSKL